MDLRWRLPPAMPEAGESPGLGYAWPAQAPYVGGNGAATGCGCCGRWASREALRLAGLDWAVERWPLATTDPASWRQTRITSHVATVRADTRAVLGVVGKDYEVFQNRDSLV